MGELQDKVKGMGKEAAGTVTGDDSTKNEGKAQKSWGDVQGAADSVKDTISSAVKSSGDENHNA